MHGHRVRVFGKLCFTCLLFLSFYPKVANAGVAEGEKAMRAGDFPLAIREFSQDAERGNTTAQLGLAILYESLGVLNKSEPSVAEQHFKQAFAWYSQPADRNVVSAQRSVARMLRNGMGVLKDQSKADEWDRRASEILRHRAEGGEVGAQKALADAYAYGLGLSQDPEQAGYWLREAAKQGDAEAFNALGVRYWRGAGVKKDLVLAYALFTLAIGVNKRDESAVYNRNLSQLDRILSVQEKAKGESIAKSWRVGTELPEAADEFPRRERLNSGPGRNSN